MTLRPLAFTVALGLSGTAFAAPAADVPMTAEEFSAYATGKTLSYAQGGEVWGSEQYLPDRHVVWTFSGEECQYGQWFEDDGAICFVYDKDPTPQCWRFFREARGLRAEFLDDPVNTNLSEVSQSPKPLACPGPDLGA
ncbi:hypothetical protein [Paragemmobacter straminiformis]|uniref:Uncharacterized protein n=1 Tax=Paragemmobacter straminiformis TaxID=2045119 RepID=A0A842I0Z8_9RHOB|nr:hypothetical protein [Gemmobacter straminiformis]MBC2833870.1 hypothetical protein [Gemmobacter straminiformis]